MAKHGEGEPVRILVVTNSYPTRATPSAAPYIVSRLQELRRRPEVEMVAVALPPTYTPAARLARAAARLSDERDLALASGVSGLVAAPVRWSLPDVARGRSGHRPRHAVRSAVRALEGVLADAEFVPEVVHAHGMYTLPAGEVARVVADRLVVPFVVSLHGSDVAQVIRRDPGSAAATLSAAAATSYVSEALREEAWGYGMPVEGSRVIPNGVDLGVFTPAGGRPEPSGDPSIEPAPGASAASSSASAQASAASAQDASTGPGPGASAAATPGPRLLYVGNLLPVKGVDRLPAVMAHVRSTWPTARLDVVGDGALMGALRRDLDPVDTLHGRLAPTEVARHMRAADVLVVPSRSEGWGCVATEALACATPVVATAVGGLPEAVGAGGILVDPADEDYPARFAAAVDRILRDPPRPESLTAAAAGRSWASVVDEELEMLAAVAGSQR